MPGCPLTSRAFMPLFAGHDELRQCASCWRCYHLSCLPTDNRRRCLTEPYRCHLCTQRSRLRQGRDRLDAGGEAADVVLYRLLTRLHELSAVPPAARQYSVVFVPFCHAILADGEQAAAQAAWGSHDPRWHQLVADYRAFYTVNDSLSPLLEPNTVRDVNTQVPARHDGEWPYIHAAPRTQEPENAMHAWPLQSPGLGYTQEGLLSQSVTLFAQLQAMVLEWTQALQLQPPVPALPVDDECEEARWAGRRLDEQRRLPSHGSHSALAAFRVALMQRYPHLELPFPRYQTDLDLPAANRSTFASVEVGNKFDDIKPVDLTGLILDDNSLTAAGGGVRMIPHPFVHQLPMPGAASDDQSSSSGIDSDDAAIESLPIQPLPGRRRLINEHTSVGHTTRSEADSSDPSEDILCFVCGRGDQSARNMIVLCDGRWRHSDGEGGQCPTAMHQLCMPYPLMRLPSGPWYCPDCNDVESDHFTISSSEDLQFCRHREEHEQHIDDSGDNSDQPDPDSTINEATHKVVVQAHAPCTVCRGSKSEGANEILLCDGVGCVNCYHQHCCTPPMLEIPEGSWLCPTCVTNGNLEDTNDDATSQHSGAADDYCSQGIHLSELHEFASFQAVDISDARTGAIDVMHAIAHGAADDESASDGMQSDAVSPWESADELPLSVLLSRAGSTADGGGAAPEIPEGMECLNEDKHDYQPSAKRMRSLTVLVDDNTSESEAGMDDPD